MVSDVLCCVTDRLFEAVGTTGLSELRCRSRLTVRQSLTLRPPQMCIIFTDTILH